MARRFKKPANIFLNISSGGNDSLIGGSYVAAAIEDQVGPLHKLSPKIAAYAASAGFLIAAGLLTEESPGSRQALYTARQVHELALEDCRVWLPNKLNYVSQFLKSYGVKVPFSKAAFHYDQQVIKNSLLNRFGERTLTDIMASIYISGHNNSAKKALEQAVLFYKEMQADNTISYNPKPETKILALGAATTAVPGNMRSENIDGNLISDYGHLDASPVALMSFLKTLEPDAGVLSLNIGPAKFHNHQLADKLDGYGLIRSIPHAVRSTAYHAASIAQLFAQKALGTENVYNLSPDVDMQLMPKGFKTYSILDSSPAHITAILEISDAFVRSEQFKRACDALGENAHLWSKQKVEAISLSASRTPFRLLDLFGKKPKKRPDLIQPSPQNLPALSATA